MALAMGKNAGCVLQRILEAVHVELTLDIIAGASHSGSVRASALDHETADNAVEDQSVIKALVNQAQEIIYRVGSDLRIKFRLHYTAILHGDGYDWILCHIHVSFDYSAYCNNSKMLSNSAFISELLFVTILTDFLLAVHSQSIHIYFKNHLHVMHDSFMILSYYITIASIIFFII